MAEPGVTLFLPEKEEAVMRDLFRGELVRFTLEEPETSVKAQARWQRDTELHRLADSSPARLNSEKKIREWIEKQGDTGFPPDRYFFTVRTLAEDKYIGFLGLWIDLVHREAWVGLGIGERDFWGKGYGSDMMKLCQQYVFAELGLERLSLGLYEYNPRALRSYEKCGFRLEGRTRNETMREGRRYDALWMGILREEWLQRQNGDGK
jgi:RimJ/RimL family protein N-acetyltransferase